MSDNYQASGLWKSINSAVEDDAVNINLKTFRHPGSYNNRLASWDPDGNSFRYYKTILFNIATSLTERELSILDSISVRNIGSPVTVSTRGRSVCLDYLLSVKECSFIEQNVDAFAFGSILEIGAGFGRTAHSFLTNYQNIDSYTIIDLGVCLKLSERYLKEVLTESEFGKLRFVHVDDVASLGQEHFDMAINIDSMAEMEAVVVKNYQKFIDGHCQYFYCKNPIGKYAPESVGIQIRNTSEFQFAMTMGLMTKVVDIFDDQSIALEIESYLKNYAPSDSWRLVANSETQPWHYYHQAIFQKTTW